MHLDFCRDSEVAFPPPSRCSCLSSRMAWSRRSEAVISEVIEESRPAVGKARTVEPNVFGGLGHAAGDQFVSYDVVAPPVLPDEGSLSAIVRPEFWRPDIQSGPPGSWSPKGGGGAAGLHIRTEPLSPHCIRPPGGRRCSRCPCPQCQGAAIGMPSSHSRIGIASRMTSSSCASILNEQCCCLVHTPMLCQSQLQRGKPVQPVSSNSWAT